MNRQQLIWAGTAITGENFTPCHDFGVCVEGSEILSTGSPQELRKIYPHAEVMGSESLLLVPGMVNSHDHGRAISTVAEGVPDDQLEIWLMHLAALPQNASSIWSMGTTGGVAVTLGKDVPLGKLAPGYLADLVLLNWEDNSPLTLDKLLRCGTRHQVNSVMVGGHWVVKNGKSQTLERESIEQEIRGQLARHSKNQLQQPARVANTLAPYLRSFYSQWH